MLLAVLGFVCRLLMTPMAWLASSLGLRQTPRAAGAQPGLGAYDDQKLASDVAKILRSRQPGDHSHACLVSRSRRKDAKYKQLAEALDYLFTDFAVETYGRISCAARKVIKLLGDMYEQLHGGDNSDGYVPRSVFVDHCRQVIGIALQRAISTQLTNNFKMRKGIGSSRDNSVDLCSSLPLDERLL